jgi:NADPH:quinone reductase-like Zn-dependent oxidoreductase
MRAAVITAAGKVGVEDWPDPVAGDGEVLIKLRRAALNRRDWFLLGDPAAVGLELPTVIGSDGAGVIEGLGSGVSGLEVGQEVVILPEFNWGESEEAPGPDFELLGASTQGTHAELISMPADSVYPRPQRLTWEESAALPLAALTAWRALFKRGGLESGQTVLITGASGGVSTYLIQIAAASGARVLVNTSSQEKIDAAKELGAEEGVDRNDEDWPKQIKELSGGGVDLAVDSSGCWADALKAVRPGGTLSVFGRTAQETAEVGVAATFFGQFSIHGTTMGSPREFQALLDHVDGAEWRPVVDSVLPLDQIADAYERIGGSHFGNIVLETES